MTDQENQRRGLYDGVPLSAQVAAALQQLPVWLFSRWASLRSGRCPCCGAALPAAAKPALRAAAKEILR